MVSVGAVDFAADKLTQSVGIVGWVDRLYQLTDPVKKYTQNYMIEHILRKNKQKWFEFQLEVTKDESLWSSIFTNPRDFTTIKDQSDEMINYNMIEAQRMIQEVVASRFAALYDCYESDGTTYNPNVKNAPITQWFKTDPVS